MTTTSRLSLPLLQAGASNNTVLANNALFWVDAFANTGGVKDRTDTPPGSPNDGDLYILVGSPSGVWADQDADDLAIYYNGGWEFLTPDSVNEGMTLYVHDENLYYRWTGSAWSANTISPLTANLDVGGFSIISTSNGDISIAPDGTGQIVLDGLKWPDSVTPTVGHRLQYAGSNELIFTRAEAVTDLGSVTTGLALPWASAGALIFGALTGNTTIAFTSVEGMGITLHLSYDTAQYTLTWSDVDMWANGDAPTDGPASGETLVVSCWRVDNVVYGSYTRMSAP